MHAERLTEIQSAIRQQGLSGWLLYDFRGTNPLARTVLKMDEHSVGSRRWFYYIPAVGEATRIVHAIETEMLDDWPGEKIVYRNWRLLHEKLRQLLADAQRVAMEYSSLANNPYISRVDAGTIELIRCCGVEVVSSGNLVQQFESLLNEEQFEQHLAADAITTAAFPFAWKFIQEQIDAYGFVEEEAVCERILQHFASHQMMTYSPPIVARQPNNRLPHYETGIGEQTRIQPGDLVMIDLWCKSKLASGIYSDLTKMAFLGEEIPADYVRSFATVVAARDAGIAFLQARAAQQSPPQGWEVDRIVRDVIEQAGFGDFFLHRTGHSLGKEVHANGAHLDDLEMHEERQLLPGSLFTIEPGIYTAEFGLRTEVNLFIDKHWQVHVTGGPLQTEIQRLAVNH